MKEFDSYKINEILEHKYYQIPQELFGNPLYKDNLTSDLKSINLKIFQRSIPFLTTKFDISEILDKLTLHATVLSFNCMWLYLVEMYCIIYETVSYCLNPLPICSLVSESQESNDNVTLSINLLSESILVELSAIPFVIRWLDILNNGFKSLYNKDSPPVHVIFLTPESKSLPNIIWLSSTGNSLI